MKNKLIIGSLAIALIASIVTIVILIIALDISDKRLDNIGKTMRGKDKNYWFDFLHTLKQFSIRHLKKFKPSNMNKMKYSMQGIAAIKEGLFESKWSGTSKTSYNKQPKKVRIIAKHNKLTVV